MATSLFWIRNTLAKEACLDHLSLLTRMRKLSLEDIKVMAHLTVDEEAFMTPQEHFPSSQDRTKGSVFCIYTKSRLGAQYRGCLRKAGKLFGVHDDQRE